MKKWLKEIARDLIALGSIPFYFLVIIRAIIGEYGLFVSQMVIAAIVILILYFVIKDSSMHVARSVPIIFFTSIFYKDTIYTIFAGLVWTLLLISAYYAKGNIGFVVRGLIIGAISSLAGYYGVSYI
jgi:hypothetical protein